MDTEVPVLSGQLIVPTQSGFSINRISKKKSTNLKFCLLFRSSRHGIERLEICDSKEDTKNAKIITLENCVKITQDPTEKLINIVTKTGTLTLSTQSDEDLTNWVTVLKNVAFNDKSSTLSRNSAIEEDNDLYCSSFSDGVFLVKLLSSETTIRCKLNAVSYNLELAATELQLKDVNTDSIVAKWPYRYIRKYGYRDGKLTFEAGRKCDTGEGVFRLDHPNPQQIFRCMSSKMKTMKNLIKGDSMGNLDCENQLSAAMSMEAGSRSPIPPSPSNNFLISTEFETSGKCSPSCRDMNLSIDSIMKQQIIIPNKPPRKVINEKPDTKICKHQNYEPVTPQATTPSQSSSVHVLKPLPDNATINQKRTASPPSGLTLVIPPEVAKRINTAKNENPTQLSRDYECIENITDAWKTLGIDEVKHTEHVKTPEGDLIEFAWPRSKGPSKETTPKTEDPPKSIFIVDDADDEQYQDSNYDRLEFFGSKNKIGSAYKTIITVVPPSYRKQNSQPVSSNDYELIGAPDIQSCRLADDSYLGYGVLRKPSLPGLNSDDALLDHRQCNGLDYAIVSKPKRV